MIKYFLHTLKLLKSFLMRPFKTIKWIKEDFKKDINSKKFKSPYKFVWCAGLPKSGSTLIEKIFENLPYVRLDTSFNRIYSFEKLDHVHGINEDMFKYLPNTKYTFLKTHTHYTDNYEKIAIRYNARIIISLRDIRDMLISRYYHILSFENHWLHKDIKNLDFTKGFIISFSSRENKQSPTSLEYYFNWIKNWLTIAKRKNYLILWYEEYKLNPNAYINKILQYIEFSNYSAKDIQNTILKENLKKTPLSSSLTKYGREKTTFRKGETNQWKKLFNEEINDAMRKNSPGDLKDVLFNTNNK